MGCCSSKSKDVSQPQKTQQPEAETIEVDKDVRKAVQIKSNLESSPPPKSRKQLEFEEAEEERARKRELERAEEKRREAAKKKLETDKKKPSITKERHAKILALVDDKYKNLQSLLIILSETLKNTERDDETIGSLMQNIKKDTNDIENALDDLQAYPFPSDKEYIKNLRKVIEAVRELDLDYLSFKKKATKYSEYKQNTLSTLHREYPELFDDFKGKTSPKNLETSMSPRSELRFPGSELHSSPHNSHVLQSPYRERPITEDDIVIMKLREADDIPKKKTAYDDAFDREMAGVMLQQKNEAVFELENAVHDYNRLLEDFNKLKHKQDHLKQDYHVVDHEAKELRDINNQLAYFNDAVTVENGTFMNVQTELARNKEQAARSCLALEGELIELRRLVQQREAENQRADQEYDSKIRQLERETMQKQQEAKELERRYQEDMRKLFTKNDEVQQQRTNMYEEVNMRLAAGDISSLPAMEPQFHYSPPKSSPPRYYDNIVAPTGYSANPMKSSFVPFEMPRQSLMAQNTLIMNGDRRSMFDHHATIKPEEFPRRSISPERGKLSEEILKKKAAEEHMESRNFEGVSSALDQARRARLGGDRNHIAADMQRMRAEIQQIPLNHADAEKGRLSAQRYSHSNELLRSGERSSFVVA